MNWSLKPELTKTTRQCRHILVAMEKVNNYIRVLKPPNCEKLLEELQRGPPIVHSNFIGIKYIANANGRSQRALMEQAQPRQLTNTTTRIRGYLHLYSVTPRMPHLLNLLYLKYKIRSLACIPSTVKVVLKLDKVLLSKSIPTAHDLY